MGMSEDSAKCHLSNSPQYLSLSLSLPRVNDYRHWFHPLKKNTLHVSCVSHLPKEGCSQMGFLFIDL